MKVRFLRVWVQWCARSSARAERRVVAAYDRLVDAEARR